MDYFELFELPYSLKVDKSYNLKKFYELSKKYHPDQFTLQDEEAQKAALQMIAQVNEAKRILDNQHLRLEYLLTLKGFLKEDEKYQLPGTFLMNVMELNEAIMESNMADDSSNQNEIKEEIHRLKMEISEDVLEYVQKDELLLSEEMAVKLKDYYFKHKYLERLENNLK